MFKNKKVLIAGGTGFVGTNLVRRLAHEGAQLTATFHQAPAVFLHPSVSYVQSNLTLPEDAKKAVDGQDYVFMCAANTSGAWVIEKTPLVHVTPNVVMNSLMLEAAYEAKVKKFCFISSNVVYPVLDRPCREEDATYDGFYEKYFCVAWMKRFCEILCQMYCEKVKFPMPVVVIRPGNIYGPYDHTDLEKSHVIPALVRKVVERHNPIEVWGDGTDIKDFIYIDDFIEGLLLAFEKINSFDPINIASGQSVSVREVLELICRIDHVSRPNIVFNQNRPSMIPLRLLDISKARAIGFEPKTPLSDGLKTTVDWFRKR